VVPVTINGAAAGGPGAGDARGLFGLGFALCFGFGPACANRVCGSMWALVRWF
jgi:hypothetical protein